MFIVLEIMFIGGKVRQRLQLWSERGPYTSIKRTALGFREGATFELRTDAINLFSRTALATRQRMPAI